MAARRTGEQPAISPETLRGRVQQAEIEAAAIGTVADAHDTVFAESTVGLFRAELIRRREPWRTLDDVEIPTPEWVDWFNNHRPPTELGDIAPTEHETDHYREKPAPSTLETREPSLS